MGSAPHKNASLVQKSAVHQNVLFQSYNGSFYYSLIIILNMISERVQTTTRDGYMKQVVMETLKASPLVSNMLKRQKKWQGAAMKFSVDLVDTVTGQMFNGFDILNATVANDRRLLTFESKSAAFPIAIDRQSIDLNTNAGEDAFLDLVRIELQSAGQKFAGFIATQLYGDGVSAPGAQQWNSLTNIIDDGSVQVNYGGLSRTTYPNLQSTVTDVSGALTLTLLRQLYNSISDGSTVPTEIYTTKSVKAQYESLATPTINIMRGAEFKGTNSMDLAFSDLAYMGMPMYADLNCPTGTLYMVNGEYLNFYAVTPSESESINIEPGADMKDTMFSNVKGFGISWSGWKEPINQYAYVGYLMLHGNFISANPRRHGKLINIT